MRFLCFIRHGCKYCGYPVKRTEGWMRDLRLSVRVGGDMLVNRAAGKMAQSGT